MATQAIEFTGPPGQTITLDVVDISDDSLQQSALTCTESTNDKGTYTTASFTDTLTGRHSIIKKISGTAFGKDYVTMANASATYQSDDYKLQIAGIDSAVTAATQASSANTKLGTPAGASVSADVAAVKTGVDGVMKSGESRSVSRTGKTTVTFTETRA